MTAKQIMDFADKIGRDTMMFTSFEDELTLQRSDIAIKLETESNNKILKKRYRDICEKLRMIQIMRVQRLELFNQANQSRKASIQSVITFKG